MNIGCYHTAVSMFLRNNITLLHNFGLVNYIDFLEVDEIDRPFPKYTFRGPIPSRAF